MMALLMHRAAPASMLSVITLLLLLGAAGVLFFRELQALLPAQHWWAALIAPDIADYRQIVVHDSLLPRVCVSLLTGAALALAGTVMQQVLGNPLAEPSTLGASAGAHLALVVASLGLPTLSGPGREWVAFIGAAAATLIVVGLAAGRHLSATTLILAGLVVGLMCGSVSTVLILFNHEGLSDIFLWSTGSLVQNDWTAAGHLASRLLPAWLLVVLLARRMALLALGDETARGLGLSPNATRLLTLSVAVALGSWVVSAVGVIGFIGLAAPPIARALGARTVLQRLFAAPLIGALLLYFTDRLVVSAQPFLGTIPTGAVTALLGAPLLLLLLPRLHSNIASGGGLPAPGRIGPRTVMLVASGVLLALALLISLSAGRTPLGWNWATGATFDMLLEWRLPRIAAALASGALLAMAGTAIQRLSGNAMASPETLGVSSGAAFGIIVLLLSLPAFDRWMQLAASFAGALGAIFVMLAASRRFDFSPDRTVLAGVMFSTLFGALASVLIASGDPRLPGLLSWMAGSTYRVTMTEALAALMAMAVIGAVAPLISRWLTILSLGETSARELGVHVPAARLVILSFIALATGAATLVVGPLSFVGLMAPHMARLLGMRSSILQIIGAALLGAAIMVIADWLGRNVLFPRQLPAGLIASLLGSPYLMWLLWRGRNPAMRR